ncbi:putative PE family protein, partial [Mycobacterium tuberculosis SUMu008]
MQPRLFQVLVISGRRFGSTGALRRNTRRDAVIGDTLRPIEGRTAMSFVIANPEMLAAAATDLAGIRSAISAATAAAAAPTIQVAAAGADEVSLAISALFGQHAQAYQALSAQATIFHDQFVQALTSGGNLYAAAESHTVEQMVLNAINAPTQTLFGRPLIGDGANGTAENPDGQNGGLLFGNGGNGFTQTTAGVAGGNG